MLTRTMCRTALGHLRGLRSTRPLHGSGVDRDKKQP